MKGEMFEFAVHIVAPQHSRAAELFGIGMKAPQGGTVLGSPRVPWHARHVAEISKRFPRSSYSYHPELTMGSALSAWTWARLYQGASFAGGVARLASPLAVPIVLGLVLRTVLGPSDHTRHAAQYEELMYVGSQFGRIQTPHNPHYDRPE